MTDENSAQWIEAMKWKRRCLIEGNCTSLIYFEAPDGTIAYGFPDLRLYLLAAKKCIGAHIE